MIIILSNLFLLMNHPVSLGTILLFQTILISINSSFISSNSWFSYILFIVLIGGLMIMFIYMTSISNNLKFKIKNKEIILFILISLFCFLIETNNKIYKSNKLFHEYEITNFFFKFFSSNKLILIFLISYLFIVLITVSKLTMSKMGPLRKL